MTLDKKRKGRPAILPIILAAAAIILHVIGLCIEVNGIVDERFWRNMSYGNFFLAFAIPVVTLVLSQICKSKGVLKAGAIVSYVLVGVQVICSILMAVFIYANIPTFYIDMVRVNGSGFFFHLIAFVKLLINGIVIRPFLFYLIRLIYSSCYLAKNLVSGIILTKLSAKS